MGGKKEEERNKDKRKVFGSKLDNYWILKNQTEVSEPKDSFPITLKLKEKRSKI